jgi:hypothetical protein
MERPTRDLKSWVGFFYFLFVTKKRLPFQTCQENQNYLNSKLVFSQFIIVFLHRFCKPALLEYLPNNNNYKTLE